MLKFVKATVIGGLVVILPMMVAIVLVVKLLALVEGLIEPLARLVALPPGLAQIVAVGAALAVCFAAGLIVQTQVGKRTNTWFEQRVLERLPAYSILRSIGRQFAGDEEGPGFTSALAEIEDALVPAFIVEEHDDGRLTVFVPAVPTPTVGAIYILAPERVHRVSLPIMKTVQCVSRWGVGSREIVAAAQAPQPKITATREG